MTLLWTLLACGDFTRDTADTSSECTDPATCSVTVSALTAECGDTGLGGTSTLTAEPVGSGSLTVQHMDFREGCCPTFSATANFNYGEGRIDVYYSLTDDSCNCVCELDLAYTLDGIRAGTWQLAAGFDQIEVVVE